MVAAVDAPGVVCPENASQNAPPSLLRSVWLARVAMTAVSASFFALSAARADDEDEDAESLGERDRFEIEFDKAFIDEE
jgi:hypothetical protein